VTVLGQMLPAGGSLARETQTRATAASQLRFW